MTSVLHFTMGPVQSFVSQSRRTRDLWSSSFLLSYLIGCGMSKLVEKGATIIMPQVEDDPLFRKIQDEARSHKTQEQPNVGSLPNRFQAQFAGTDETYIQAAAQEAKQHIQTAWEEIAQVVWNDCVQQAASKGQGTSDIWQRQIKSCWDIQWVIGDDPTLLDRRKNWRLYTPSEEPGDKCTLMQDWQELSGYVRAQNPGSRQHQDQFWQAIRHQVGRLDLRDQERLSAIALIKRLFPKVSKKAIGWDVQSSAWPSTSYIAAIPWLAGVMKNQASIDQARLFVQEIQNNEAIPAAGLWREQPLQIPSLQAWHQEPLLRLDGRLFYANAWENGEPFDQEGTPEDYAPALKALKALYQSPQGDTGKRLGPPSPYYGLLLMDGDSLGALNRSLGAGVSKGLAHFTKEVKRVVREHDGVVVYAGGDDLLAMLPVPQTLGCASAVAKLYQEAFQVTLQGDYETYREQATISAGVVFAHAHVPLYNVLREAHSLLDDVAKDKCGRASIAVSVWKPSGRMCQYSSTWQAFHTVSATTMQGKDVQWNHRAPVNLLEQMASVLRQQERTKETGFSSSFVYRLREQMGLLCGWPQWKPGIYGKIAESLDIQAIQAMLEAEYLRCLRIAGWKEDELASAEVDQHTNILLECSYRTKREFTKETGFSYITDKTQIGLDGVLLARFLSNGGHESTE